MTHSSQRAKLVWSCRRSPAAPAHIRVDHAPDDTTLAKVIEAIETAQVALMAVLADMSTSVLVIFNGMRMLRKDVLPERSRSQIN